MLESRSLLVLLFVVVCVVIAAPTCSITCPSGTLCLQALPSRIIGCYEIANHNYSYRLFGECNHVPTNNCLTTYRGADSPYECCSGVARMISSFFGNFQCTNEADAAGGCEPAPCSDTIPCPSTYKCLHNVELDKYQCVNPYETDINGDIFGECKDFQPEEDCGALGAEVEEPEECCSGVGMLIEDPVGGNYVFVCDVRDGYCN